MGLAGLDISTEPLQLHLDSSVLLKTLNFLRQLSH